MNIRCQKDYPVCGYRYDPSKGDPEHNIAPGTPLGDLLKNWACARCVADTGQVSCNQNGGDQHDRCD